MMTIKPDRDAPRPKPDGMRILLIIGGVAAFLAVLGLVIMVFWYIFRAPRF
jgi:hypothetical protein